MLTPNDWRPSFETLVRAHQQRVIGLARNLTLDAALAEEIAQEVFLALHSELPSLRDEHHLVAWLRRVTCHRAFDQLRRRRTSQAVSLVQAPQPESDDGAAANADFLLNERLRRWVGALPEAPRQVVVLRYQEDLTPDEIARTLEMPVNTVKSHLRRGLELLRAKAQRVEDEVSDAR